MNTLKDDLLSKFEKYVSEFDMSDPNIERKYFHSIRVMEFAIDIAKSEGYGDNDIEISTVSGLLHDYARFPQWEKYHTYEDKKSIDHGDLGVKLLFDDGEIKEFYDNVENYDEIYDSIKNHNKCSIPSDISNHNYRICKVIRDADKLDIFDLFIKDKISFDDNEDEISRNISKCFYNHENINHRDIKNNNEKVLLTLAMIYDINFKYSINHIIDNNIIWKLYDKINNKELFKEYFDYLDNYLKKENNM